MTEICSTIKYGDVYLICKKLFAYEIFGILFNFVKRDFWMIYVPNKLTLTRYVFLLKKS